MCCIQALHCIRQLVRPSARLRLGKSVAKRRVEWFLPCMVRGSEHVAAEHELQRLWTAQKGSNLYKEVNRAGQQQARVS